MTNVSLIVISHNQPDFIRRLLEGITDPCLDGLEVIVSDDCSTDSTVAVARECLDVLAKRGAVTKVLASYEWGGAGGARNKGAKLATGKFVWMFDGDDIIKPGAITNLLVASEADVDCVAFGFTTRLADRDLHWVPPVGAGDEFIADLFVAPWSKIIRREKLMWFRERCSYEDFDWWFRQADRLQTLMTIREELVVYDRTSGGSSDASEWLLKNARRRDPICGEHPFTMADFMDHPEILKEAGVGWRAVSGRLGVCAQMWNDFPTLTNPAVRTAAMVAFKRNFGAMVCP